MLGLQMIRRGEQPLPTTVLRLYKFSLKFKISFSYFNFFIFKSQQARGRFQVSSIDKRVQTPSKHLNCQLQQKLLAMDLEDEDSVS